jgi:hypothetical protein
VISFLLSCSQQPLFPVCLESAMQSAAVDRALCVHRPSTGCRANWLTMCLQKSWLSELDALEKSLDAALGAYSPSRDE